MLSYYILTFRFLILDDGSEAFSAMQGLDSRIGLVDAIETMSNEMIDLKLSTHDTFDKLGNIGAGLEASKGGALPHAAGDELKRPSADFVS